MLCQFVLVCHSQARLLGPVPKFLIEHSLDYKLENHPLHPTLVRAIGDEEKLARQILELEKKRKELSKKLWEAVNPSSKSMTEREDNMRKGLIARDPINWDH